MAATGYLTRIAKAVQAMSTLTTTGTVYSDWQAALHDAQFMPIEAQEKLAWQAEAVVARHS